MINLSKRDIKLLILLACVLLLAASYMFGYSHYGDMRAEVEEEKKVLQQKYEDLSAKNVNREKYQEETKNNTKKQKEILAKYPSKVTVENEIYFTKLLQDSTKVSVKQFAYTEPESFYVDDGTSDVTNITGYKAVSTISFEADYDGFKKMIRYINEAKSRRVINNINMSVDGTTGKLAGTMSYNDFYLEGADCEFNPETIKAGTNGNGVSNIFGNLVKN